MPSNSSSQELCYNCDSNYRSCASDASRDQLVLTKVNQGGLRVLSVYPRRPGASFPIPRPNGDIRCMKSKEFLLFRRELSSLVRCTSMTSSWVATQIFVELIICFFLNVRIDNTAGQPRTMDHLRGVHDCSVVFKSSSCMISSSVRYQQKCCTEEDRCWSNVVRFRKTRVGDEVLLIDMTDTTPWHKPLYRRGQNQMGYRVLTIGQAPVSTSPKLPAGQYQSRATIFIFGHHLIHFRHCRPLRQCL